MKDIQITATSIEEFTRISEKIKELPEKVLDQIEKVDTRHWISCYIKQRYTDNKDIYIPRNMVTQISDFGDYIGIYCGDFFLKAPKADFNYTYILID